MCNFSSGCGSVLSVRVVPWIAEPRRLNCRPLRFCGGVLRPPQHAAANPEIPFMIYIVIMVGSFVLLTGSALLALRWALRTGQLRNSDKAALLVFNEEEPVGEMTDHFPGRAAAPSSRRKSEPHA